MDSSKPECAWYVYIVRADSGKLYTGITTDIERRFKEHGGRRGARFFRFSGPAELLYNESYPEQSAALKREAAIKKMRRSEKLELIKARI